MKHTIDIQNTVHFRVGMRWQMVLKLTNIVTAIFLLVGYGDGLSPSA